MTDETKPKQKRNRSPEHPAFDLGTAIERARTLKEAEHHGFANTATAMSHWGYGSKSSAGIRTLAALIHFGLIEEEGTGKDRRVRLSGRGRILSNPNSPKSDRETALHDAALGPAIYRKLWEGWRDRERLPSDGQMAYDLEETWGFNPKAISGFIRDIKSTLELASLLQDGILSGEAGADSGVREEDESVPAEEEHGQPRAKEPMKATTEETSAAQEVRVEDYTIPLRGAGTAVLSLPVPLSQKNYEKLKGWLVWAEDSLVTDEPRGDE